MIDLTKNVYEHTRDDFVCITRGNRDSVREIHDSAPAGVKKPGLSWVLVPALLFLVARFSTVVVIGAAAYLMVRGYQSQGIFTLGMVMLVALVVLYPLRALAHACFTHSFEYAVGQAMNSESGWMRLRWLWVSYRLIRDFAWLVVPSLQIFAFWSRSESKAYMLSKLVEAADYLQKSRIDLHTNLDDMSSYTQEQRYKKLVLEVQGRLNKRPDPSNSQGTIPGLRERMLWWVDLPWHPFVRWLVWTLIFGGLIVAGAVHTMKTP